MEYKVIIPCYSRARIDGVTMRAHRGHVTNVYERQKRLNLSKKVEK